MRDRFFRSVAVLAWLTALTVAAGSADEPSETSGSEPAASVLTSPLVLIEGATARVELIGAPVEGREATTADRRAAARGWLEETIAPLTAPACHAVLDALGHRSPFDPSELESWAAVFPSDRPIAEAPGAERILVPERSPPLDREALELLRASGLLPIEVVLAGEGARVAAARHAGPPLRPALLRHARAARLEGVARLAGLLETLEGTGVQPADIGLRLLSADRDRVGWNRERLVAAADDPIARGLLKGLVHDGLRWALYHYLRGGHEALLSALERPGVDPARLLRPGRPRLPLPEDWPAEGCRLGPRGALALVYGQDELPWLDGLTADVFVAGEGGTVEGRLLFEGSQEAARAAAALDAEAVQASVEGSELRLRWVPGGGAQPADQE